MTNASRFSMGVVLPPLTLEFVLGGALFVDGLFGSDLTRFGVGTSEPFVLVLCGKPGDAGPDDGV